MIVERVLVQGGGIGGLIAATALAQRGVHVDVVERRPAGSVLGVGLNQPANALRVMAEIGVLDECLVAGYQHESLRMIGPDGAVVAEIPCRLRGDRAGDRGRALVPRANPHRRRRGTRQQPAHGAGSGDTSPGESIAQIAAIDEAEARFAAVRGPAAT